MRANRHLDWRIAVAIVCIFSANHAYADSAEDLLKRAAAATSWSADGKFDFECKNKSVRIENGKITRAESHIIGTVIRRGDFLRVRSKASLDNRPFEPKDVLARPDKQIMYFASIDDHAARDAGDLQYTDSPKHVRSWNGVANSFYGSTWALDGVMPLDDEHRVFSFSQAAKEGKVTELAVERIGEIDCRVVQIVGAGWQWKVWIAPGRGDNIAKFEMSNSPDHIARDPNFPIQQDNFAFKHDRLGNQMVLDSVEFAEIDVDGAKRWIISAGRLRNTAMWGTVDEKRVSMDAQLSRSHISLKLADDDLKALESITIPNGMPVMVITDDPPAPDTPPKTYQWVDGKPVAILKN